MLYSMVYDEEAGRNVVSEAPLYQVMGLNKFIKSMPSIVNHENDNTMKYIFDNEQLSNYDFTCTAHTAIVFTIKLFNYKKMGLQGTYDDFYELTCNKKTFTISYNKDKLSGFCGWVNRLTTM